MEMYTGLYFYVTLLFGIKSTSSTLKKIIIIGNVYNTVIHCHRINTSLNVKKKFAFSRQNDMYDAIHSSFL